MSDVARGRHRSKAKARPHPFARDFVVIVFGALVISALVRGFLVQAFFVPSGSMERTLLPSDRIVAAKIVTRISGVHRGEVLVFTDPGGWLGQTPARSGVAGTFAKGLQFIGILPADATGHLVKRVIGIAGDHVMCCDAKGHIVLNGLSLIEPYLSPGVRTDQIPFDITVPPDSMFVLGDNRPESADSRYHLGVNAGSVMTGDVVGRAVAIVWPLSRMSVLSIPKIFSHVPAAPAN